MKMKDEQFLKDGAVLSSIAARCMAQPHQAVYPNEQECDALERWALTYAARRGVTVNPNHVPKPWAGAKGDGKP